MMTTKSRYTIGMVGVMTGRCDDCGEVRRLKPDGTTCLDGCSGSEASTTPAIRLQGLGRRCSDDGPAIAHRQIMRRLGGRQIANQKAKARRDMATKLDDLMNNTERAWSYQLESQRQAGAIRAFAFQPMRLRLSFSRTDAKGAKSAWYTPDFMVVQNDGTIAFDEVKGHWEEASKVRIRVAADAFPMFTFRTVRRVKKRWDVKEVKA